MEQYHTVNAAPAGSTNFEVTEPAAKHSMFPPESSLHMKDLSHCTVGAGVVDNRNITVNEFNLYDLQENSGEVLNRLQLLNAHNFPTPATDTSTNDEVRLKEVLDKRAKEIYGELILPVQLDLEFTPVQLELKAGVERKSFVEFDEEGHFNRREDFEKLIMRPCIGNLNFEQIFKDALKDAEKKAKYERKTPESHKVFLNRYGSIVVLIGQAGMGKTTLAKKMVELSLQGKIFPTSPYIFYIPFREVDFLKESTLFRFLMTGCCWTPSHTPEEDLVKKLEDNPNVIFIFDGLDEVNTERLFKPYPYHTMQWRCRPDTFVRYIFSGKKFPLSKKLVTSRPRQFFQLDQSCRPRFAVDILGLNEEEQDKIGRQICQNKFDQVKEFLRLHPDVSASCYVPVKCIIIFAILSMSIEETGKICIQSLTDIFVQALNHFIRSDHLHGEAEEIWKLATLAWKGLLDRKIVFTAADFKDAKISQAAFQAFLVTVTDRNIRFSILEGDKRSSFSHLIWQELFAAIKAVFLLTISDFESHFDKLKKPLWEVVAKFMFGLFHPSVMRKIKSIFPSEVVLDLDAKKEKLHQQAVLLMKAINADKTVASFLQLCSWIQEADDQTLTESVVEHLPDVIVLPGSILPSDSSSLLYVLQKAIKPFKISACSCTFAQDSLHRLLKGFSRLPVKVHHFDFTGHEIDDDLTQLLVDAMPPIELVAISRCKISSRAICILSKKISSLPEPWKTLDLGNNNVDDDAARSIADALDNIKELRMWGCSLSKEAIVILSSKIASLSKPMEELDLSWNVMDDDAAASISNALCNIQVLNLKECRLSPKAVSIIREKIASLSKPKPRVLLSNEFHTASVREDPVRRRSGSLLRYFNCCLALEALALHWMLNECKSNCFQCNTFQVHQTKKAKKWQCKMCGAKQSLLKVFFQGSSTACRKVVQESNGMLVEKQSLQDATNILHRSEEIVSEVGEELLSRKSKWEKFKSPSPGSSEDDDDVLPRFQPSWKTTTEINARKRPGKPLLNSHSKEGTLACKKKPVENYCTHEKRLKPETSLSKSSLQENMRESKWGKYRSLVNE